MKKQLTERLQQLAGIKPLYQLNEILDMDQEINIGDVYLYMDKDGDPEASPITKYAKYQPITIVRSLGVGPDGVEQFDGELETGTLKIVTRFELYPMDDRKGASGLMGSPDRFNQSTKTIAGLADLFLDTSKKLRKGEYKGIQATEIDEIDDLLTMVLTAAEETNITAVIQRLEGMLGKSIKDY